MKFPPASSERRTSTGRPENCPGEGQIDACTDPRRGALQLDPEIPLHANLAPGAFRFEYRGKVSANP